jgi:TRAP-type C4-dicarboxylate transport system substrate-binding protein
LTIRAEACEMIRQRDALVGGDMFRLTAPGAICARLLAVRRFCAAPALTLALAFGIVVPASAQDQEVDLRLSLWVPPAHPLTSAAKAWGEDIAKASGGTIKVTVFPSEQLGKAFDHYDMARDDIADITYVNPGYQPGRFPIIAIGQMPFMFGDARKGTAALDSWYRKYAATEMKDTHFCFAFIHDPGALHSRKKIVLPQDLRGEGAAGAEHDCRTGNQARRHECAGLGS